MRDDLYRTVGVSSVKVWRNSMIIFKISHKHAFLCTHDNRLWLESSTTSWPRMTWRSLKSWSWPVTAACVSWAGAYRDTLPAAHPPWQPSSSGSLTNRSPPLQTMPILLSGYCPRYASWCKLLFRVSLRVRMPPLSLSLSLPLPLSLSLSLSPPPPLSLSLSLSRW